METNTEIKYIFENINDLLKYAEAKNGGLIVFNSALIIGILSSYSSCNHLFFKPSIAVGIICFGISIFLSLLSQFPVTQNLIQTSNNLVNVNLYFFGHLAQVNVDKFINEFQSVFTTFIPTKFDKYLINQIIVNSKITATKFLIFKYASYISVFGIGVIGVGSIIKIICH
jgi:hypothetical protein